MEVLASLPSPDEIRAKAEAGARARAREALARDERRGMNAWFSFAKRMLTEADPRLLRKFAYNFGIKGVLSVEKYKRRLQARRVLSAVPVHLGDLRAASCAARAAGWMSRAHRNTSRSTT